MTTITVGATGQNVAKNFLDHLNLGREPVGMKTLDLLVKLRVAIEKRGLDEESAVAVLQSFEAQFGAAETPMKRLEKFVGFVQSIDEKANLIDTVKDLGLLSKSELEEQAIASGNWIPFMKRVEQDKRDAMAAAATPATEIKKA